MTSGRGVTGVADVAVATKKPTGVRCRRGWGRKMGVERGGSERGSGFVSAYLCMHACGYGWHRSSSVLQHHVFMWLCVGVSVVVGLNNAHHAQVQREGMVRSIYSTRVHVTAVTLCRLNSGSMDSPQPVCVESATWPSGQVLQVVLPGELLNSFKPLHGGHGPSGDAPLPAEPGWHSAQLPDPSPP